MSASESSPPVEKRGKAPSTTGQVYCSTCMHRGVTTTGIFCPTCQNRPLSRADKIAARVPDDIEEYL